MMEENTYPLSAEKLNIGALLLTPVWGLFHKKYLISVVALIPIIGLVASFMAMIYGGRWAWDSMEWQSEFEFKEHCFYWNIAGVAVLSLVFIILILF